MSIAHLPACARQRGSGSRYPRRPTLVQRGAGRPGGQRHYANLAIETVFTVHAAYHLPLRLSRRLLAIRGETPRPGRKTEADRDWGAAAKASALETEQHSLSAG
jgi:hypothetical protein